MGLSDLLARRRMVRSFDGTAVDLDWLQGACADALRAPTAGNSAGVRMCVLGPSRISSLIDAATDPQWRERSRRLPGIARAGAAVVVTTRPQDYLERYRESDKADSGLSEAASWEVPYWHTDAAMATMALLLLVEEADLGAALWGAFRHESSVLSLVDAPEERLFATLFIGHPDGGDHPSSSLSRPVPSRSARVRRLD